MLDRTFLHLPGIGEKRERRLWKEGILDWETYRRAHAVVGVSGQAKRRHDRLLDELSAARSRGDIRPVAAAVPRNEHWRFFGEGLRTGFLDIETTGTAEWDSVTVVGVLDSAGGLHQLVRGDGLDHATLAELLGRFDLLVTFNGNGFDIPVLRRAYPGAVPDVAHLDLRGPLARLGYKGGLKRIEVALGLSRPDALQGLGGYEAVLLWERFSRRGNDEALGTLLAYNREDVVNMVALAAFTSSALHDRLCPYWGGAPRGIPWPTGRRPGHVPREVEEALAARPAKQRTLMA